MALAREELSQMAYTGAGNGNALWFYSNSDSADIAGTVGYFNDVADELSVGDLIYDVDGAGFVAVSDISNGVVTVAVTPAATI